MPIYAYKCGSCGHAKDVLQKLSDAPLSVCPACGKAEFSKQVTAAGFQLKGSGWYATDFKGGSSGAPAVDNKDGKDAKDGKDGKAADAAKPADGAAKPAESAAPAAKPATPVAATGGGD